MIEDAATHRARWSGGSTPRPLTWLTGLQRNPSSRSSLVVGAVLGAVIAGVIAVLMTKLPFVWTFILFAGVAAVIPAFVVREPFSYWLFLFLLASIVDVKKTLLDGLAVMDTLGLVAITPTSQLVPEIRLSDLVLAVLLLHWMIQLARHRASLHFPRVSILVVAFLVWSAISSLQAEHPYLGLVEWTNQFRYFVIFLYAANNIRGRRALALIGTTLLLIVALQSIVTTTRYVFGFGLLAAGSFGRADAHDTSEHLNVVRGGGGKRAFGTVLSPRGTAGHLLLLLPWPALIAAHSSRRSTRILCVALLAAGTVALILTYSRAAFIGYVLGMSIAVLLAYRWGFLSRRGLALSMLTAAVIGAIASPIVISFINKRPDNVRVRVAQFETTAEMIRDNPVFGVGLNNGASAQRLYKRDGTSGVVVTDATKLSDIHPIHSQVLTTLVETGAIGFALYFGFFAMILRDAARLTRSKTALERIAGGGLLVGALALFVQFLADPILEHSIFALLWFLCGVVWMLAHRDELRLPSRVRAEGSCPPSEGWQAGQ